MYQTYVGEKKALIFPVMCDGYLAIEYRQGETGTRSNAYFPNPQTYGIWDTDSFTIETIITPYDINGNGYYLISAETLGNFGVDSEYLTKKSLPQVKTILGTTTTYNNISQSNTYLSKAHRLDSTGSANNGYKMSIFWNENVELYLQNTTTTSHNQPAEYQICLSVKDKNAVETIVRSGTVITSRESHSGKSKEATSTDQKYSEDSDIIEYDRIGQTVNAISEGATSLTLTNGALYESSFFYPGQKLYTNSGQTFTYLATVSAISDATTSATVTITAATHAVSSASTLYQPTKREAPYLLNTYHIGATFDINTGVMSIYLDGILLNSTIHTGDYSTFYMYPEDCKIGQGSTSYATTETIDSASTTNTLYSQFMGEMHEFAISKESKNNFESINTLLPNSRDLLLYYRFEEVDL
tara:strand:+ start:2597 stop:3835 length:1239 start_codon:yes stop_codon:yes gene_type:complete